MAGYRPKSLEELNSLYDKSLNIKNEIDRKASDLEVKQEIYTPASVVVPKADAVQEIAAEETATEEISGLVDDFIKNFGAPVPVKRVRPVAPSTFKAVSSAKNDEAMAPAKPSSPVKAVSDKPRLIRNSERNDLFENYKKVMDDEDDDDFSFHRRGRKRGKKLFEKKAAPVQEIAVQEESDEADSFEAAVSDVQEPVDTVAFENQTAVIEDDIPETLENIDAVIEKVLGKPAEDAQEEVQEEFPEAVYELAEEDESAEEADEIEYEDESVFEQQEEFAAEEEPYYEQEEALEADEAEYEDGYADSEEEAEEETEAEAYVEEEAEEDAYEEASDSAELEAKKSYAGKNIILALLLLVLVLATAVSAVKAFAGINSDTPAFEKYHLYSADEKFIQGGIKKGDLVVVLHESVEEGKTFAYKKGDGQYGFATLDGLLNEDTIIADNDGQKSIVFRNTVRGTIYKTIPVIGTFAAMIASNYLYIIGGLLLLAAILILVLVLAFRDKKKKKAPKKVKEKKVVYEAEAEETVYDDVEGDFRYLIQEDAEEDGYDVYRNGGEAEEEGLPVYEADDYKYEPDEYVNS